MKHEIEAVAFCLGWLVSMLCVYFAGKNVGRCEREIELIRGDKLSDGKPNPQGNNETDLSRH